VGMVREVRVVRSRRRARGWSGRVTPRPAGRKGGPAGSGGMPRLTEAPRVTAAALAQLTSSPRPEHHDRWPVTHTLGPVKRHRSCSPHLRHSEAAGSRARGGGAGALELPGRGPLRARLGPGGPPGHSGPRRPAHTRWRAAGSPEGTGCGTPRSLGRRGARAAGSAWPPRDRVGQSCPESDSRRQQGPRVWAAQGPGGARPGRPRPGRGQPEARSPEPGRQGAEAVEDG
jgi:hypothetical protein